MGKTFQQFAERTFRLSESQTTLRTEIVAGITTFCTMAYIIFVQPAVLSGAMFGFQTGMDFGAVTTATCLSAAIATALMGLYARYPIALAPGMGQNFFFVFSAIPAATAAGFTNPWQVALGAIFIAGEIFLVLSLTGIREGLLNAISPSLKHGIAVGIGLFIAFVGLQNSGVIIQDQGTSVKLNVHFGSPDLILFFFGLILTAALKVRGVKGAILWGILGSTLATITAHAALPSLPGFADSATLKDSKLMTLFHFADGVVTSPPSLGPTFFQMDLVNALSVAMLPMIVIFLFMDMFDTMGTLIGVSEQAGLMKDGQLPRANRAFLSDAAGTVVGAALGTSTVTSYIESASGVEAGGRTGLTAVTTAVLFLLALFFSPIIAMVGSYPVITAPALVVVGALMMQNVTRIDWHDASEALPAFLIMLGIPLCYSIGDGLALGFITYPFVKLLGGKGREVRWPMYVISLLLIAYFAAFRAGV